MYQELTAEDHRRLLRIDDAELPDVLLLLGVLGVNAGAARFAGYLEDAVERPRTLDWQGRYGGLKVGLAACFGGPMAAYFAHSWCSAGVPVVVQLGWFGALQPGMALGDVLVPRHAERQDGVSDWYLPKGILADATPELAAAITSELGKRGISSGEHAIYSTPALLAESRAVIADWSRHGYQGVDMETAAMFAVAKSLGAARAAALIRFDDLVSEEDSIAEAMPRERREFLREREREVTHAVLDAVVAWRGVGG
jgi:uridine phosphorylase